MTWIFATQVEGPFGRAGFSMVYAKDGEPYFYLLALLVPPTFHLYDARR
jgi:hypothetical protein